MVVYTENQTVTKEHAEVITSELKKRGSKTPSDKELSKCQSLACLLLLACGGGKYALRIEEIASIGNSEFSISVEAIKKLCGRSPSRALRNL